MSSCCFTKGPDTWNSHAWQSQARSTLGRTRAWSNLVKPGITPGQTWYYAWSNLVKPGRASQSRRGMLASDAYRGKRITGTRLEKQAEEGLTQAQGRASRGACQGCPAARLAVGVDQVCRLGHLRYGAYGTWQVCSVERASRQSEDGGERSGDDGSWNGGDCVQFGDSKGARGRGGEPVTLRRVLWSAPCMIWYPYHAPQSGR